MSLKRLVVLMGLTALAACSGSAPVEPGCIDPESGAYLCSGTDAAAASTP